MLDTERSVAYGRLYEDPFVVEGNRPLWIVVDELVHTMLKPEHTERRTGVPPVD